MNSSKKIAVLIFALSDKEQVKSKRFLANSNLPEVLNQRTQNLVEKSGLDYFISDEQSQQGNTFGERFANAIASVFAKGYDSVITIGNDTPNLKRSHLLKAERHLSNNSAVIGPSYDGGFYLMGLQKEFFNKEQFINFSWNTRFIKKQVKEYLQSFTQNYYEFSYQSDIDASKDVEGLIKNLSFSLIQLLKLLQQLLHLVTIYRSNDESSYNQILLSNPFNKGSPQLILL